MDDRKGVTGPKTYLLSPDEPEHQRLKRQHDTLVEIMNGTIVRAPLINPKQILDVSYGTGIVTCYLGERFPDALVWGIDISPVPPIHDKPKNVLICGMTDWKGYIETSVNMLKPGGHLEIQQLAWRYYTEGAEVGRDWEWLKAYYAALQAKGLDPYCVGKMDCWMRDAGMDSIQMQHFPWPFTIEQRRVYEQLLPKILTGQGYSEEKTEALVKEAMTTTDFEGLYKEFCVTLGCKKH